MSSNMAGKRPNLIIPFTYMIAAILVLIGALQWQNANPGSGDKFDLTEYDNKVITGTQAAGIVSQIVSNPEYDETIVRVDNGTTVSEYVNGDDTYKQVIDANSPDKYITPADTYRCTFIKDGEGNITNVIVTYQK